jgi:hypothetical protein
MTDPTTADTVNDEPLDEDEEQEGLSPEGELDLEAPEADTAEQQRVVVLDEDEYR